MSDRLELVTIDEAARRLSVHPATVRSLVRSGQLQASKVGPRRGGVRVHAQSIERYVGAGSIRPRDNRTTPAARERVAKSCWRDAWQQARKEMLK